MGERQVYVMDVHNVYDKIREDKDFHRWQPAKLVPGEGAEQDSQAFIIGDMPSAQDVLNGRPFTNDYGIILRQLMELAGLHSYFSEGRQYHPNCWLTLLSKYRSTKITWEAIQLWRPYLREEWKWVDTPNVIIPVGRHAFSAIMGERRDIEKSAGFPFKRLTFEAGWIWVWPMLHPIHGIQNPRLRPVMETHWKKLGEWLDNHQR